MLSGELMRIILYILLLLEFNSYAEDYHFGEGVNIPTSPIYVGGYATLDYISRTDDYNRFRVDELAFLSYGYYDKFSYMLEVGLQESYIKEWGLEDKTTKDDTANISRLYIDYMLNDALTIRAGKFNTPAGYWNMEPINILRATSSIPWSTYLIYPRYSTGIELNYCDKLYSDTVFSLVVQENTDLDDRYNNISVNRHYLGSIEHFISDNLKVKANLGYFKTLENESHYYGVVALSYEAKNYQILSEFASRKNTNRFTVPYSFYLQGVWHILQNHDLVSRLETYKIDEGALREEVLGVFGYTYRPDSPFTFKIEYRGRTYSNENQIRTSISVMF